ncbi:Ribonuclease H domain [Dillenia turbinata]|uniref:Ribonuclease H domain n=1 Tax=Dillenia turbinata TaxID=194707 RepID=A0AAN8ZS08_9MAGN
MGKEKGVSELHGKEKEGKVNSDGVASKRTFEEVLGRRKETKNLDFKRQMDPIIRPLGAGTSSESPLVLGIRDKPPGRNAQYEASTYFQPISSGKAGAGSLIRDSEGIWITGFHAMVGKTNVLMEEIWGLREGLLLAKKCNLRRVEVESDSATLIKLLNGEVKEDHKLAKIIEECQNIMQEIDV